MRATALIVGVVTGLAGFGFAYMLFIFLMFAAGSENSGYPGIGMALLLLLFASPLIGTIGGLLSYFKPSAGGALIIVSAAGWILIAALAVYLVQHNQAKSPGTAANLSMVGFILIPALLSLLAWWVASLAARRKK